ncbi:MAG TPA: hypothetical protein VG826_35505 [Pirellulales bacterium]|nr:hypothetical protein [Pirellulales bacterium]
MEENRKKRDRKKRGRLILVAMLVFYPLSIGPAVTVLGATNSHPAVRVPFMIAYAPLVAVVKVLPRPCQRLAERWVELWDFYRSDLTPNFRA